MAEALEYWNCYTHISVDITRTTALYRALDWWQGQANYYYARARWIVFIVVLVFWKTVTAKRDAPLSVAQQGVGRMGVGHHEKRLR